MKKFDWTYIDEIRHFYFAWGFAAPFICIQFISKKSMKVHLNNHNIRFFNFRYQLSFKSKKNKYNN